MLRGRGPAAVCQALPSAARGGAKQFHRELAHSFEEDNNLK